jgi:universal stress protein E
MKPFTNILVDIDARASAQPALEVGVRIARRSRAQLSVVDVTTPAVRRWSMGAGGRYPSLQGKPLPSSMGALREAATRVRILQSPAEALVEEAARGHDLLIRSHSRDFVARGADGGVNVHLFRHSPCSIWALGPGALPKHPRIVAAVDPSSIDPVTETLNQKAIEVALHLAELEAGSVAILHAWRAVAEKQLYTHSLPAFDAAVVTAELRADQDLRRLVSSFDRPLVGVRTELRKGDPEEVIPDFVVAEGIDIVVAGARSGRGVWQRLFGSTAERLLQASPCSVVAVKEDR